MKNGRTLQQISDLILKQHTTKKDYVVGTGMLTMLPSEDRKDVKLAFNLRGEKRVFTPTPLCLNQIADRVGIPKKYADRLRTEAPELLATNVNHWFANKPEKRMLRTLNHDQNVARAFLSEGYRPLDNFDLASVAIPQLREAGCEIRSMEITESRFYIQASTPRIQSVIEQETKQGGHTRIQRTVQAGVIIGNSEVGMGAIYVEPLMYDLVCTNGLILERALRKHHAGRRAEGQVFGDESSYELFSDSTRKLDDQAFWAKVQDVIKASMNEVQFNANIDRLKATQQQMLADKPKEMEEVVEVTAARFTLNDEEKTNLFAHFASGGDYSGYGLIQAVTRTAEDCPSYDRAVELERLGGVLVLANEWGWTKN